MTIVWIIMAFGAGFIVSTLIEAKRQQKREDNWNYWTQPTQRLFEERGTRDERDQQTRQQPDTK